MMPKKTNNGRDKLDWSQEIWDRIDVAVHDEAMRTKVASKFLPIQPVPADTRYAPSDIINNPISATDPNRALTIDEGATTSLFEIWVEFALTPQQVESEADLRTAVTLATRATNILSQAEDLLIFQGQNAFNNILFNKGVVQSRGKPADEGLLNELPNDLLPTDQVVKVLPANQSGSPIRYAENTFAAVAEGYSKLQGKGQYGPYALVLQSFPYADTFAPLKDTLIMPADRIRPLVTAGFYGTGTLPTSNPSGQDPSAAKPQFTGLLVSLGGDSMDVVVGLDATACFQQQDTNGAYRFRVVERFALRLKDTQAVIRLEFQ
jgi:uncharacterized linocin/CFP29 family protein